MCNKKRYVQVGIGGRARFFYQAMAERFSDTCELTAICDINPIRMEYAKKNLMENFHYPEVKTYGVDEFEKMILEQKPDYVLVTSIDRTTISILSRLWKWAAM
jgi:predicted dehydrogenase